MAHTTAAQTSDAHARNHLRSEVRIYLILSASAFAAGLAIGFTVLGLR